MNTRLTVFFCIVLLCCAAFAVHAMDFNNFWQFPEMADKHALFAGVFAASFSLLYDTYFQFEPEVVIDYLLPFRFPFSLGISGRGFKPHSFAAGIRPGYHINLDDENTDLYAVFTADVVFQDEFIILDYGGRIGLRRRFGRFFCIHIESGHKFESLNMGVSIKIN